MAELAIADSTITGTGPAVSDRWNAFAGIVARTAADYVLPDDIRREVVALMIRQFHSMLLITGISAARRGNAAAARVAAESARRLGDRRVVLAILLVDRAARIPGVRSLLDALSRSRRPYTGERLTDGLRSPMAISQIGVLTGELIDALTSTSASSFGAAGMSR